MSEQTYAPIKDLKLFHRNPRKGNIAAIAESLEELGQYRPITVNRGTTTGRPNEILTGNHTYQAAKRLGWPTVAVAWVDVDEDTAARIVVADNRTSDLGGYDDDALTALLGELPNLTGTGYSDDDLQDLLILQDTFDGGDEGGTPPEAPSDEDEDEDDENRWEIASRKTIILGYPLERFVWVTDKLGKLGKRYGTTSNAETLKRLLEAAK